MARTGAFTNWVTLSSDQGQMPEVIEAVTIERPAGGGTYDTFYYATQETDYRLISPDVYIPRLKSIGSIVSQLGNGQGRVTIRLQNGDLGFRDDFTVSYVTSAGRTEASGSDMFIGSKVTIRKILIGEVSGSPTETDLIFLFGTVTGARYTEEFLELDVATDVNLAPTLSNRRVGSKCPWVFKGTECGYSGGLTTCNKLYTDSGGCSGRSNQHRFGGFPVRDSAAAIGKVTGLGSAATYQLIQAGSTYQEQRMITAFDDSFGVTDDSGNDRTVVSAITPDWINVQSTTYKAAGVDTTTTGSITSGTASLTVASASSWKVGQGIRIAGAGAAGAALTTTISAISGTTFTLATNASTTVSSASVVHDDTTALQTAINDGITNARPIYIPKGTYRVTGLSVPGGATIIGDGPQLTVIKSVTNAVILNCPRATNDAGPYAYQGARIERIGVLGSVTAGSSQIGIKCDDPVYALGHYLDDVRISDCGSHGLYIGNSFSSHFEKIYSTNSEGFNFKIYSPNMPCVTLHQCNTGTVRSASPVGFMIVSGSIRLESCNGIYGGAGTDWWGVVGGKANLYGETVNSTAYVQFVNCNFESNTVGGIRFLNNSRGDFDGCAWVGDASGSGSYKALLYDVDLVDRVSTTGSITSGTNSLTVASANSWTAGQGIKIAGAGAAGADLSTTISSIAGNVFTLAVNASTTVSGAVVTHTDDLFYPWEGPKGFIADNCLFTQSPITYYANSQPIHISAFPTTGNAYPPLQTLGQGPKMSGGKGFIASFYNDSASTTRPLIRADANAVKQVITASTTFAVPGVRYIECNHTGAITVTLPWAASYSNIGQPVVVKDISSAGAGTNNITINSGGGGTVNGSSYVISQNKGAVTLVPDGSNDWRVVGEFRSASVVPLIFPDGSTSSLAIQRSGDSDTGLFIDANGFYFSKDGTEYARIVGNDNQFKGVVRIKSSGLGQSYLTVDNEDLWIQFNSTLRWVMEKNGRLYPAGQNTQDLGYSGGGELRTGYFGTSLDLGRSSNTTGTLVLRNATNSNTTTIKAGAAGANLVFTWPTDDGTNGQALTTDGNGVLSWTTITGGGGGTVTSVGLSLPSIFTVSGSPVTSSGTLTGTLATQVKNSIFAGPSAGVDAAPTFRSLVDDDIPNVLTVSKISNLTSNGFVKTSAGDGTLSVDTNTYLTANQTITLSGDVTGSGSTSITTAIAAGVIVDADINASAAISISKLAASAITIAGTSTSLGGSISRDTITGLSTTGVVKRTGANTLTAASVVNADIDAAAAIAVSKLAASTISGVTLGSNLNTLTIGTGLSGSSYNGSAAVTIAIDSTVATLSGSQTLSNKTLNSAILTGTLTAGGGVGTNGQFLQSTATGVQWATVSAAPGGSNTQVQFNDGGVFGGDAGLVFDKTNHNLTVGATGTANQLRLVETGGGTDYVALRAPSAVTTSINLTLPGTTGSANQVLTTDGSGVLSWATASSGGRTTLTANRTYYVGFDLGTCTISNASPGVVTLTGHGLSANDPVIFSTTGTLPAPLIAGAVYYVKTVLTADTFTVSLTSGGTVINTTSAGSGTHRARTGKDTQDGLTSSRTGAVLTINKAIELACAIDLGPYAVTIQLAQGRYLDSIRPGSYVGVGPITILGDTTTPANVVVQPYSQTTNSSITAQASNNTILLTGHGFQNGTPVQFETYGSPPTGITMRRTYYVINATTNAFQISETVGGSAVTWASNITGIYCGSYVALLQGIVGKYTLAGLTIGSNAGLYGIRNIGCVLDVDRCTFAGLSNFGHMFTETGGYTQFVNAFTIAQGASSFFDTSDNSVSSTRQTTITLQNTPAFTVGYARIYRCAVHLGDFTTIASGSATGPYFDATYFGVVRYRSSTLPGNATGNLIPNGAADG